MKKQFISAVVGASLLVGSVIATPAQVDAAGPDKITYSLSLEVLVNARKVKFPDAKPKMVNGSVLVPIRVVTEKLNGKVLSVEGKDIVLQKGDRTAKLSIGSKAATVNGKAITLNAAPEVYNSRTYVPLRFISEAFGEQVEWDSMNQFVWIGSKAVPKLEDAIKPIDIKPFEHYYKNPYFLEDPFKPGQNYKTVRVITEDDFPLIISKDIYYRMDPAKRNGEEYIRSSTNDKGVMGRPFLLLTSTQERFRDELSGMRESVGDFRIHYNAIVSDTDLHADGIKDYANLMMKNIEYFEILADSDAKILFKNPWR
ncbi:hypothetical protein PCCS19_51870 [Paenibacillus sp. CCS19]|uniref:copper amine oxidase N-terminal domain-containing protein n=1 Tax=Paenibacillus sp. CCS19 TaxID=3158387 RepID=UPI002563D2FA|nr:copper amine oxidase N-terminal domain-containing protein [Paenibacillus cellulosilyticus]GMK42128.1 hypothetical protein PCCS19_51870 [Paenibacillus cellulosilyticus]